MDPEIVPLVFLRGGTQSPGTAELRELDDGKVCLNVRCGEDCAQIEAFDFFEALQKIRLELAERDLDVHCYGASRNVHPSAMARSMGSGRRAYRLTMGQPGRFPLVDIFESGAGIDLAPVAAQEQFYRDWLQSIRDR